MSKKKKVNPIADRYKEKLKNRNDTIIMPRIEREEELRTLGTFNLNYYTGCKFCYDTEVIVSIYGFNIPCTCKILSK